MATFTITTPVNIDTLTSKAGSDTYNINGGYLTVDQDSRYGTNNNTSAAMGNITLSATLGGTIEFNATKVRLIPYDTGTGNVPASNTTISQGSASGLLIGVYSALNVAPTTAGSAMPASGYIKIKQWNDTAYSAGALSGISANATGADVAGWIEIVGVDALLCTVNRLNLFKVRGEWYEFQGTTTSGSNATTYQIPSNGSSAVYLPGVWVETGTSTGVYEFYPCAGSLTATSANVATDAVRGKVCWISTAGLLRFQNDGTNSTGGYLPPSGRKIRIPNIFFMCCTAGAPTVNVLPNATLATRFEFATTGGGALDIDKCCMNWYMNINQPYSCNLSNMAIMTAMVLTECATPVTWSQVGVGQEAANTQFALSMSLNFAGGTIANCTWCRALLGASGNYVTTMTNCSGFSFTDNRAFGLVARGNATTGCHTLTRVSDSTWSDCIQGVGRALMTTCDDLTFTDTIYYDHPVTTTATTNPMYAFDLASKCSGITIDGLSFGGLTLCQPYSGILNVGAAGCTGILMKNLGTFASKLDLGGAQIDNASWSRVTTTATVTSVAHGLKTNDIIYVITSDNTAAISIATKTVASTPTADTFTFTCTNSGSTSGVLTYYPVKTASLYVLATGAAANDVKIKRCYCIHNRSVLFSGDNSSKNVLLENVTGDFLSANLTPMLNMSLKGVTSTMPLTAQTSCYGTHWFDEHMYNVPANTAAVSWSRTTTTATITSTAHGLRTGMLLNVTVSSDTAAITLGIKQITVVNANTFTFTCLNAGGASGTLTFIPFVSRIGLLMNEATAETSGVYVIDDTGPQFTSAGGVFMPTANDQLTFETPEYIIGHTAFPVYQPVVAGGTNSDYYDVYYAIDINDGNGYSSFKNLSYIRAGGGGSNGSTTITMTSTTGVAVDDYVFGANVGPLAKVVSIDSGTNITVTVANTGTVSGNLRFCHQPNETIDAEDGFKLKIRIKTNSVGTPAAAITSYFVYTQSTDTARAYQYPLNPTDATFSFSGLDVGTEVVLFNSSNVELDRQTLAGTVYEYDYTWKDVDITDCYALIWKDDRVPIKFTGIDLTDESLDVPISQQDDLVYATPGVLTPCTINYTDSLIEMDAGTTELNVQEVYSRWKDDILVSNNAQYDFAFYVVGGNEIVSPKSIPFYVFQNNGWKFRPDEANHTLNVTGGIIVGESGDDPFVDTVGAYRVRINYEQPVQAITVSTGGGGGATAAQVWSYGTRELTSGGNNAIADQVWDEAASGHIAAGSTGEILQRTEKKVDDNQALIISL